MCVCVLQSPSPNLISPLSQTNINDRAFTAARTYPVNMQVGQTARVPNFWHPRLDTDERPDFVLQARRLWFLVVRRKVKMDEEETALAAASTGKRTREGLPVALFHTLNPHGRAFAPGTNYLTVGPRNNRKEMADNLVDASYWSIEPWSSVDSRPPPRELYENDVFTGAALYFGFTTDLYGNHQSVTPQLGSMLDHALYGYISNADAQKILDRAPRVEVMMGNL